MNTIERIKVMQAFVDGKNIECTRRSEKKEEYVYLKHPVWNWSRFDYRIKQNWYDNIPESGVLCWVSDVDNNAKKSASIITNYNNKLNFAFTGQYSWKYATPLTRKELELYLSACPN